MQRVLAHIGDADTSGVTGLWSRQTIAGFGIARQNPLPIRWAEGGSELRRASHVVVGLLTLYTGTG